MGLQLCAISKTWYIVIFLQRQQPRHFFFHFLGAYHQKRNKHLCAILIFDLNSIKQNSLSSRNVLKDCNIVLGTLLCTKKKRHCQFFLLKRRPKRPPNVPLRMGKIEIYMCHVLLSKQVFEDQTKEPMP